MRARFAAYQSSRLDGPRTPRPAKPKRSRRPKGNDHRPRRDGSRKSLTTRSAGGPSPTIKDDSIQTVGRVPPIRKDLEGGGLTVLTASSQRTPWRRQAQTRRLSVMIPLYPTSLNPPEGAGRLCRSIHHSLTRRNQREGTKLPDLGLELAHPTHLVHCE
jgi:hypothetical protein